MSGFEPVHVTSTHYMLYATGREPERFETPEEVLVAYTLLQPGYSDVEIRTVIETAPESELPIGELLDDALERLMSRLLKPTMVYNFARAGLIKRLAGADDPSSRSAEKRYRNARREILAALTEYQENK